jgi:hypothetical protein
MPVISMFFGITVSMYFMDNRQHKRPHIHARFGGDEAVFAIPEGDLIEGALPRSKTKLVQAWSRFIKTNSCWAGNWRSTASTRARFLP